jgi:hypothetical protein
LLIALLAFSLDVAHADEQLAGWGVYKFGMATLPKPETVSKESKASLLRRNGSTYLEHTTDLAMIEDMPTGARERQFGRSARRAFGDKAVDVISSVELSYSSLDDVQPNSKSLGVCSVFVTLGPNS